MRKCIPLVVLLVALAGCASMTPEQKGRLQFAQDFADEVTKAYNAPPGQAHILYRHELLAE